ncbi:uncharacterized protein [Phyllobates terribilis]|uniref:uncharacterized protein isoform X2 n=1 Tax=Phyllobates terribilis TaxID=111132 RepID=UPI003CCA9BFD
MGDDDSRTKGSGLRVDDSSESLESLPNRDEQWENVGEDPSKSGRRRLKSISMSDLDIEHHPSDNMQESRNKKSTSASDLKDKPQDGDNMQNYPVYRINMGGTEPSLTESGFVAEGSCWPTPSESFQTFYNSQQSRICENPWTNSLPRRHLDRSYTGDTWSSLTKSGFVTGGSSKATHPDTMCNIEEHNNNSDSPSKTPREEKSLLDRCGDSDVEEEKKQRKKSRSCCRRSARMPLWLIIGFLVIFCAITAVLLENYSAIQGKCELLDWTQHGPERAVDVD